MAKKNKYDELANCIVDLIGGKENISFFTHCITRLRFNLKDKSLVKTEEIGKLQGVLGSQWSGEQLQVIIGAAVTDVYNTICNINGFTVQDQVNENLDVNNKKKFSFGMLFETLSGCMVPIIPALCAAGIIKGVLFILTTYCGMTTESGLYTILNEVGDVAFCFMPFLVAFSASKKFKTNTIISLMLAGVFLHPSITALAGTEVNVLGINVYILNYSSTVFPIIISVWILSYVYRFIDKHLPSVLRFVLTPALSILTMTLICLGVIGPIGYYLGYYLATTVAELFYFNSYIGGFVLGAIRAFVLLIGMQTTFTPIIVNNMSNLGYDFIWPVHCVFAMCCCGLSVGAFVKAKMSKKKEIKSESDNFFSSAISAFTGVSEPALYGNAFRYKRQLMSLIISAAVCGSITAGLGGIAVAPANPAWLFLPTFGSSAGLMVIMFVVSFVISAVLSFLFGFEDTKKNKGDKKL